MGFEITYATGDGWIGKTQKVAKPFPERLVLDQLYVLFDSKKDLKWVSSLPIDRFIDLFPEYTFKKMVLFEDEMIWIYRVVPKDTL